MLFLGSFPPRECGIATFTKDVVDSFDAWYGVRSDVVAIEEPDAPQRRYPANVVAHLVQENRLAYAQVAAFVNAHPADVLSVQHEYGLFGGSHGEWLLDLLARVRKPTVVSMHTVLPEPSDEHLRVTRAICACATSVVALSRTGCELLVRDYGIDAGKVHHIPHGAPDVPLRATVEVKRTLGLADRKLISTFGLINRGKGLEYAIEAMREIVVRHPDALYLILGETHPLVRRREGEAYRETLQALVERHHLEANVRFVNRYFDIDELVRYLQATDVYLTPYLNPVQIVSGTLAYAMGCGKAIVSTPYLYAKELLADDRGMVVGFRDAAAIAGALVALLDDAPLRSAIEQRAFQFGRNMTWPHVAREYGRLFASHVHRAPVLASA